MESQNILLAFVLFSVLQYLVERYLAAENRKFYLKKENQDKAMTELEISRDDLDKSIAYAEDRYLVSSFERWVLRFLTLIFIALGGLGVIEGYAQKVGISFIPNNISTGLSFFALIGFLSFIVELPFSYYRTFVIEERHGFNRQTKTDFWKDTGKGLMIGVVLGGLVLSLILWIMTAMGSFWWVYAWIAMSSFSLLAAWIYPTLLAPIFNKFTPLPEGELNNDIQKLAKKIQFNASSIFVMDASKRSSHGNAYFTGLFQKKRIVLFDTLVDSLTTSQIVSVLAHELGHFKLNHVRWMMIRSIALTGLLLFGISICMKLPQFYYAFGLEGISNYGALAVFSIWFGLIGFWLSPFQNGLSRRNEFAADRFALKQIENPQILGQALLRLREKSHGMPIAHPWYSLFYYSHPPLMERLTAMRT